MSEFPSHSLIHHGVERFSRALELEFELGEKFSSTVLRQGTRISRFAYLFCIPIRVNQAKSIAGACKIRTLLLSNRSFHICQPRASCPTGPPPRPGLSSYARLSSVAAKSACDRGWPSLGNLFFSYRLQPIPSALSAEMCRVRVGGLVLG